MSTKDIIDTLAGIEPGSGLDAIRARRLQARENAQKSYLSLFEPIDAGDFSLAERAAVAAFVTGLHGESPVAAFYRQIPADPILGPMYPAEDLDGAEVRLRNFLIFRFGGPPI